MITIVLLIIKFIMDVLHIENLLNIKKYIYSNVVMSFYLILKRSDYYIVYYSLKIKCKYNVIKLFILV